MKLEKLFEKARRNAIGFKDVAEKIINIDRDHEEYEDAVQGIAMGMAMGSALTQRIYITTGVVIGVASTVIISKVSKKFKKEEVVIVNLGELSEFLEKTIEIEKEKLEKESKED